MARASSGAGSSRSASRTSSASASGAQSPSSRKRSGLSPPSPSPSERGSRATRWTSPPGGGRCTASPAPCPPPRGAGARPCRRRRAQTSDGGADCQSRRSCEAMFGLDAAGRVGVEGELSDVLGGPIAGVRGCPGRAWRAAGASRRKGATEIRRGEDAARRAAGRHRGGQAGRWSRMTFLVADFRMQGPINIIIFHHKRGTESGRSKAEGPFFQKGCPRCSAFSPARLRRARRGPGASSWPPSSLSATCARAASPSAPSLHLWQQARVSDDGRPPRRPRARRAPLRGHRLPRRLGLAEQDASGTPQAALQRLQLQTGGTPLAR